MLKTGDQVPRFSVTTLDGRRVVYRDDLWQRKNLVLVSVPPQASAHASRVNGWALAARQVAGPDNEWVLTADEVEELGRPGALVADQWGEICFVTSTPSIAELPDGNELIEWLLFVQRQCPECQGETR